MPGELAIPAGMVLLAHAADFIAKTGEPITDQDVGDATQLFVQIVMHVVGPDKGSTPGEPPPADPAAQPAQQPAPPAPGGGIVAGAM